MLKQIIFNLLFQLVCFSCAKDVKKSFTTPLIVGGENATKHEFPWIVLLAIEVEEGSYQYCTGTLIRLDSVLTSASCVIGHKKQVTMVAGEHIVSEFDGLEQLATSTEVIIHEEFNSTGLLENDIALVRMSYNLKLTDQVRPISLPEPDSDPDTADFGIAAGWGEPNVSDEGTPPLFSDILLKATVRILSSSVCALLPPVGMVKEVFCTSDSAGGYEADMGGPLLCNGTLDSVCGILSYSEINQGQNENLVIGVYLKVSWYLDWIEEHMRIPVTTSTSPVTTSTSPVTTSTSPITTSTSPITTSTSQKTTTNSIKTSTQAHSSSSSLTQAKSFIPILIMIMYSFHIVLCI